MPKPRYDPGSIRSLFDEMAATYGYVNLISSFGFTSRWRRQSVTELALADARCVIDLMSGMGELWRSLAKHLPDGTRVIGVDLSPEMARRTPREWRFATEVVVADVLTWDVPDGCADAVVSSFGLKTFTKEQQRLLAEKVAAMLRPGGTFSFIEVSVPPFALLRLPYMFYLTHVIPILGRLLLGNPECYRMLGVYTRAFGDAGHFASCLKAEGLEARVIPQFWGCATRVVGSKAGAPLHP